MPHPNPSLTDDLRLLRQHHHAFNEVANRLIRKLECAIDADGVQNRPKIILIQEIVAAHYSMPISVMTSKLRPKRFVEPRQVAMYITRELTNYALDHIGYSFGGRDHGTVKHACNAVVNRIATEPVFANQIATMIEVARERLKDLDLPLFSKKQQSA